MPVSGSIVAVGVAAEVVAPLEHEHPAPGPAGDLLGDGQAVEARSRRRRHRQISLTPAGSGRSKKKKNRALWQPEGYLTHFAGKGSRPTVEQSMQEERG